MPETTTLYYRAGTSDKFYTATLDGNHVTFTWGRRGTKGQTKTFSGGRALYNEKLAEKRAKGYRPNFGDVPSAPGFSGRITARPIPQSTRPAFNDGYDRARENVAAAIDRLRTAAARPASDTPAGETPSLPPVDGVGHRRIKPRQQ